MRFDKEIYDIEKAWEQLGEDSFYKDRSLRHLFSQNEKMMETIEANPDKYFINFNIPALKTCPCRGECENLCYALSGRYIFKNVIAALEWRWKMSKRDDFRWFVNYELEKWKNKKKAKGRKMYVRVHDSGDYYNKEYAMKWIQIAKDNPDMIFYSYTKCVSMWHEIMDDGLMPDNYRIIMSTMGKEDALIRPTDRRAVIVKDKEHIVEGMIDGTGNDYHATYARIVALPYHGTKKVDL